MTVPLRTLAATLLSAAAVSFAPGAFAVNPQTTQAHKAIAKAAKAQTAAKKKRPARRPSWCALCNRQKIAQGISAAAGNRAVVVWNIDLPDDGDETSEDMPEEEIPDQWEPTYWPDGELAPDPGWWIPDGPEEFTAYWGGRLWRVSVEVDFNWGEDPPPEEPMPSGFEQWCHDNGFHDLGECQANYGGW